MKTMIKPSRAFVVFALGFCMAIAMVAMQGCPGVMGKDVKSYAEMSPVERATYVTSIYNDQYALYLREAQIPDLTEEKKKTLRNKKNLMMQLYPYIGTYNNFAEQGVFAPADVEIALMKIMDKLLGL